MLKLKHIVKDYETKQQTVHVLKDLNLNFRECEFVTILGQSGCGKTTLLNIIGGLDRYTSGDIIINGKSTKDFDDRDWDKYRNKQIGFVFQSYNLIPHLDVLHNVELALTLAGKKADVRKEKAMDALCKVGLEDQAYKKPNQLSGGQMQRVAIARALVNDPAIILADEPTGALDSESGTMVMDLLKEVARDRLVILVSHNSELANKYSTRTVKLKDGTIVDDSNPFIDENDVDDEVEANTPDKVACGKKNIRQRFKKTYKQVMHEIKEERRVSMNGATTLSMSARNLYSKKWRTFLTSFAGSIGIIGIALVLALSSGINTYIKMTEESALSIYPLQITSKGANLTELAKVLMGKSDREKFPNTSNVYINRIFGNLDIVNDMEMLDENSVLFSNDLTKIKKYLDANLNDNDGYVKYSYSSKINIYRRIPNMDGEYYSEDQNYTKINPFTDSLSTLTSGVTGVDVAQIIEDNFGSYIDGFTVFDELVDNQNLLNQQYDVIGGAWPKTDGYAETDENGNPTGNTVYECVVQVDSQNQIADYLLFAAGLLHPDEVGTLIMGKDEEKDVLYQKYFTLENLLNVEYKVLSDSDYYSQNVDGSWKSNLEEDAQGKKTLRTKDDKEWIEDTSKIKMKVVGIVRGKENAKANAISGIIGYPHSLLEAVVERCQSSAIMEAQYKNCTKLVDGGERVPVEFDENDKPEYVKESDLEYRDVTTGEVINYNFETIYNYLKTNMGFAEIDKPESIYIYAASFEGKQNILALFDQYKADNGGESIKYTDMLATLMDYVKQLTNAMITALVAFSSISLIVSSIMISIITYTSVLERRKEIGVLRSIGARKLDISNLFVSESSIIGIISGILGISFGYLFIYIANVVINSKLDVANLLSLRWYYAVSLIIISFLLALVAGIIPASIAARKDPVQALRTE